MALSALHSPCMSTLKSLKEHFFSATRSLIMLCYYAMAIFGKTNLVESNKCSWISLCSIEPYLMFSILPWSKLLKTDSAFKNDLNLWESLAPPLSNLWRGRC